MYVCMVYMNYIILEYALSMTVGYLRLSSVCCMFDCFLFSSLLFMACIHILRSTGSVVCMTVYYVRLVIYPVLTGISFQS